MTNAPDAGSELLRQMFAYRLSQAIHVAATLGIADLLTDGPRSSDDLATATTTNAPSLYRLLRALAAEGIFQELPDRCFALTPKAELLRKDAPVSLHAWAEFLGRPYFWQGWGELLHSVTTGKSGVEKVVGMDTWAWREQHPEETGYFDRAMTSTTRTMSPTVVGAYDWGQFNVIADIAGGHGAQLADILAKFPGVHGILFDQPHVVDGASAILGEGGVADRCEVVGGSFFDSVPKADAYILKHILHDWYDADCVRILKTIRAAAPPNAHLLVIERLIEGPNRGAAAKSSDLNMLVGPGGMERTLDEFGALLIDGGWRLVEARPAGTHHVMESVLA
jgi:O-methyltransferase/methyltransferase family protein